MDDRFWRLFENRITKYVAVWVEGGFWRWIELRKREREILLVLWGLVMEINYSITRSIHKEWHSSWRSFPQFSPSILILLNFTERCSHKIVLTLMLRPNDDSGWRCDASEGFSSTARPQWRWWCPKNESRESSFLKKPSKKCTFAKNTLKIVFCGRTCLDLSWDYKRVKIRLFFTRDEGVEDKMSARLQKKFLWTGGDWLWKSD